MMDPTSGWASSLLVTGRVPAVTATAWVLRETLGRLLLCYDGRSPLGLLAKR